MKYVVNTFQKIRCEYTAIRCKCVLNTVRAKYVLNVPEPSKVVKYMQYTSDLSCIEIRKKYIERNRIHCHTLKYTIYTLRSEYIIYTEGGMHQEYVFIQENTINEESIEIRAKYAFVIPWNTFKIHRNTLLIHLDEIHSNTWQYAQNTT